MNSFQALLSSCQTQDTQRSSPLPSVTQPVYEFSTTETSSPDSRVGNSSEPPRSSTRAAGRPCGDGPMGHQPGPPHLGTEKPFRSKHVWLGAGPGSWGPQLLSPWPSSHLPGLAPRMLTASCTQEPRSSRWKPHGFPGPPPKSQNMASIMVTSPHPGSRAQSPALHGRGPSRWRA